MQADVASDRVLKVGNGGEHAASDAFAGDGREEALDGVDPGCRGRGEVEHPARMFCQPCLDLRMFVRGVVVGDGTDELARRDGALDGVEELDELLIPKILWPHIDDARLKARNISLPPECVVELVDLAKSMAGNPMGLIMGAKASSLDMTEL